MKRPIKSPSFGVALIGAALLCGGLDLQGRAQEDTPAMAVAEIQYIDTSGEPVDQSADHFRRLRQFEASLRTDLAASGKIKTVSLDCPANACSVGDIDATQLLDKAKAAGAAYLLIGSVHKQSTLIQWAKFDIIDVKARNVVFNRLVTFRGDNDKAWSHAESFVVQEILDHKEN
ncbi:MAG TPA: DUF2380 domain-containing protein [Bradyrhizobium sp.]|nr:DUF2380 domain-containing protein [Bradyrhizobium sp.]